MVDAALKRIGANTGLAKLIIWQVIPTFRNRAQWPGGVCWEACQVGLYGELIRGERGGVAISATSPLTGDELDLSPVKMFALQATQLRLYASRSGWRMPISPYEHELYVAEGLKLPKG